MSDEPSGVEEYYAAVERGDAMVYFNYERAKRRRRIFEAFFWTTNTSMGAAIGVFLMFGKWVEALGPLFAICWSAVARTYYHQWMTSMEIAQVEANSFYNLLKEFRREIEHRFEPRVTMVNQPPGDGSHPN